MANDTREQSPTAQLFQKTHSKMVSLSRVEEQIAALINQRRRIAEELRELQGQINGEFERIITQADDVSTRIMAVIGQRENGPVAQAA